LNIITTGFSKVNSKLELTTKKNRSCQTQIVLPRYRTG